MHTVDANGANIPAIGLGTWDLRDLTCVESVAAAIADGYRHIDTAAMYENEEQVGEGLRASGMPREQIFLTTKVWYDQIGDGDLQRSLEQSLDRLGVDHVDLALIHWPSPTIPLAASIAALNDVRNRGLARNIGVSNFPVRLLDEAVALSEGPLACNQVEYHPMLNQDAVLRACRRHGMAMVSYCPLFRGGPLFESAPVLTAAQAHGRTPAQIVLRWHVQQDGVIPIPRTRTRDRITENFGIFDFELSDQEMAAIFALNTNNTRLCDFEFSPQWD